MKVRRHEMHKPIKAAHAAHIARGMRQSVASSCKSLLKVFTSCALLCKSCCKAQGTKQSTNGLLARQAFATRQMLPFAAASLRARQPMSMLFVAHFAKTASLGAVCVAIPAICCTRAHAKTLSRLQGPCLLGRMHPAQQEDAFLHPAPAAHADTWEKLCQAHASDAAQHAPPDLPGHAMPRLSAHALPGKQAQACRSYAKPCAMQPAARMQSPMKARAEAKHRTGQTGHKKSANKAHKKARQERQAVSTKSPIVRQPRVRPWPARQGDWLV